MTLNDAAQKSQQMQLKLQSYAQFFRLEQAMMNSREDILTYRGQTGFHVVTWVVLHILPYTRAGEPLLGFADRLDGTRWVGLANLCHPKSFPVYRPDCRHQVEHGHTKTRISELRLLPPISQHGVTTTRAQG